MKPGIAEFDAGSIDPDGFDHAEHIRLAWLYLKEYGKTRGAAQFRDALRRFTQSIGAESKYHETMTSFFVEAIGDRLDGSDWGVFKAANADLFDAKALLLRHYSAERLNSPEAKVRYLAPDRNERRATLSY